MNRLILNIAFLFLIIGCSSSAGDDSLNSSNQDTSPPSIPSNLIASNITETSLNLSWNASSDNIGIQTYIIFQNGTNLVSNATTSRVISGLQPNTNYTFKVLARDAAGNTSGFSTEISVSTLVVTAELQFTSGDIETYLGNFIDNVPGDSGNHYKEPTTNQLFTWEGIVSAVLTENINEAVEKSSEVNYQIKEFTDTSLTPNKVFYILEEKDSKTNYWGTYVFSKTPKSNDLIIQAPHIKNDLNTGKQAVYCFKNNISKAVFLSGTHRCNNSSFSSCSGTTSTCGSSESYRVSDVAHNTHAVFQKTTEIVFNTISSSVFIQLHGFSKQASDPYVILSNGTREIPTTDYTTLLKDALFKEDNTLTFKIAHIDTDWTRLIGFTNTQGRLINSSLDICNTSATNTSGRFIHVEQERSRLRDDVTGWTKMSNALNTVFN